MRMRQYSAIRSHKPLPEKEPSAEELKAFGEKILKRIRDTVAAIYHGAPPGQRTIKEKDVVEAVTGRMGYRCAITPAERFPSKLCKLKTLEASSGSRDCFFFPKATFRKLVKSQESKERRLRWTKKSMLSMQAWIEGCSST